MLCAAPAVSLTVRGMRTEYMQNPMGIDNLHPRFSWLLQSGQRGMMQSAYQIRLATSPRNLRNGHHVVWDSQKIASQESIQHEYQGPALQSGQRYYWQVRVWDQIGNVSSWSDSSFFEMGLLQPSDWSAKWIEPAWQQDKSKPGPSPMLRREFKLKHPIARARLYVTSHGLYELQLNGKRVGDAVLTPGWTSYNKRLQYQTYDVTDMLKSGANAIGATLADGWYRGLGFTEDRDVYGDQLVLLLQIKITYRSERQETIITDENWKASTGPILMSEIYHGETYDARLEMPGWSMPGFDDHSWSAVHVAENRTDSLVAPTGPPVHEIQEIKPIQIIHTPAGETVVDMGQNMVGWSKLKVQGPAGTMVKLRHAEVLDQQGNFYNANYRDAKSTIEYILKGGGPEVYEPHFTFQGFRYLSVEGYPGLLTLDSLTGVVVHSDLQPTSEFTTSNKLINQLQHNIVWGQKGNFVDVPTDCPQRDERLGWTGDAQVFSRTAAFNMDVAGFFTKWLKDLAADQYSDGNVPWVIPDVIGGHRKGAGSAGWSDSAIIIPWNMYLNYGDKRLLKEQYKSMARWVEYERLRAGDDFIWDGDPHFGDWLAFATDDAGYPGATTGKDLIATAFYAHSADLMRRVAEILGKHEDALRYGDLFTKVKDAFTREYVSPNGRVGENTQTSYVLALQFDLLPEELRPIAARRLVDDVRKFGHLTTGFLGTPYLCEVLTRYGYLEEAYLLLNNQKYPSWLYPVLHGATTIWERWDGIRPDGSFQNTTGNSFNHYAYGSIGDWMYRVMGGIEIDEATPAYKHIFIQPQPGGGFTSVKTSHDSMYGTVSSSWQISGGTFELAVSVPPNSAATIRLPAAELSTVMESHHNLVEGNGILGAKQDGSSVVVEVGSGEYLFSSPMKN
jgi:alpha-L-rhamnosidase